MSGFLMFMSFECLTQKGQFKDGCVWFSDPYCIFDTDLVFTAELNCSTKGLLCFDVTNLQLEKTLTHQSDPWINSFDTGLAGLNGLTG